MDLPDTLRRRVVDHRTALDRTVTSGTRLGSGLGTSEPHSFYAALWDHIRRRDLEGLEVRQAMFMAPHPLLIGDRLARTARSTGDGDDDDGDDPGSAVGRAVAAVRGRLGDARRLRALAGHLDELQRRRITFVSAFMDPVTNTVVPDSLAGRVLASGLRGRNRARAGVTAWQPVHFPDATALAFAPDTGEARVDVFVCVTTPPDDDGWCSFGPSNGANGDVLPRMTAAPDTALLLYLNDRYPRVPGLEGLPNGLHVTQLERLADEDRLCIVIDDAEVPAMPPGSFGSASTVEQRIGDHAADHITAHLDRTAGRALQVGIGGTGLAIVERLRTSPWRGRLYTELLDPVTWSLVESGVATGSHVVRDATRHRIDDGVVATFAIGESGDGFYRRIAAGGARMAPASVVLQESAFAGGLGINNVLGIDFQGNVNVSAHDRNPYSGVGGAAIIHRGLATGGIAYLCVPSTHHDGDGNRRSSIFPFLPGGTPVTLTAPDLMGTRDGAAFFLVTEHGVAQINGVDQQTFIRRLASVAHPDFRDELARAAWDGFRVRLDV